MTSFPRLRWLHLFGLLLMLYMAGASATPVFPDMPVNRWVPVNFSCQNGLASYSGGCPSTRGWVQLGYDSKRKSVMLMGGSGEWYFNDLWLFDPAIVRWTSILLDTRLSGGGCAGCQANQTVYPGGVAGQTFPTGRDNHQLIYDSNHDLYWVFGGTGDTGFWRFNPNAVPLSSGWTNMNIMHDSNTAPYAKFDLGTAWVASTGKIYFFGGETIAGYSNETWAFDTNTSTWSKLNNFLQDGSATLPQERGQIENAMVYDTVHNQMILFGGRLPGGAPSGETWTYNVAANAWAKQTPATSPAARDEHFMTWDSKNNVAIMGGGQYVNNDTWLYNPGNNTWQELVSARGDYSAAWGTLVSMVYVPDLDLSVLRDVKGNMYLLRLDLTQPFGNVSTGPVNWTPAGVPPLPPAPPPALPSPSPVPPAADTVAPTVNITNPLNGATIARGVVTLSANAADNVAVTSLQLLINDTPSATTNGASLTYNWDNSAMPAGSAVSLKAIAKDAAGNQAVSTVNVVIAQGAAVLPKSVRGDFNADARADVLWRNEATGENWLYMMSGTTIAAQGAINTVSDLAWKIAGVADFNGDGKADILWHNNNTGENWMYLMNGTGIGAQGRVNVVPDLSWKIVGTGDFNGDGKAGVLWRHQVTGENWMYLMNGLTIVSQGRVNLIADQAWTVVGTGDFNGDGKADIVWRNSTTGDNMVYLMSGLTVSSQISLPALSPAWSVAGVADFNGDGKADILWRNSSGSNALLYLLDGSTLVSQVSIAPPGGAGWRIATVGDYNGDGKADILWRNDVTGENIVYLMNGGLVMSQGSVNIVSNMAWKVTPLQ